MPKWILAWPFTPAQFVRDIRVIALVQAISPSIRCYFVTV